MRVLCPFMAPATLWLQYQLLCLVVLCMLEVVAGPFTQSRRRSQPSALLTVSSTIPVKQQPSSSTLVLAMLLFQHESSVHAALSSVICSTVLLL